MVEVGMLHLGFAVELIVSQMKAGNYFVFEQPRLARSWQTEEV